MDRSDLQDLRRALAARKHPRGRLASTLRQQALTYARRRRRAGATVSTIAAEVGLAGETIRRWTTPAESAMSVRPVPVEVLTEPARLHTVISPSGFRVEGLTLDEAAALLRALR